MVEGIVREMAKDANGVLILFAGALVISFGAGLGAGRWAGSELGRREGYAAAVDSVRAASPGVCLDSLGGPPPRYIGIRIRSLGAAPDHWEFVIRAQRKDFR